MLGRASARVDENSRKRMKALGERGARGPTKRSMIKGKERLCAKTRGTCSMDELGDHTNFIRDETGVHYSSLPVMLESQSKDTAAAEYKNDVQMNNGTNTTGCVAVAAVPAPGHDGIKPPVSTRPHGTQLFPPRATLSTRHSQKRIEPPSPTPHRSSAPPIALRPVPAPTPVPAHRPKSSLRVSDSAPPKSTPAPLPPHPSDIHSQQLHPVPVPTPLPPAVKDILKKGAGATSVVAAASAVPMTDSLARHGRSTSTSSSTSATAVTVAAISTSISTSLISAHPPPSQTHGHGPNRALGMTRIVPRPFSSSPSNNSPHSAVTKKPFRPPLVRPSAAASQAKPQIPHTSSHSYDSQRQRRQEEGSSKKGSGADPDSSFDLSFDFDPEALEAAMKQYD